MTPADTSPDDPASNHPESQPDDQSLEGGLHEETDPEYQEALLRFVERFALVMVEAGMPRMPARVFAYVLADDATRYTARELSEGLRVSPAAISGAVRYLVHTGMLTREREPGSRSDHYTIDDEDVWQRIYEQRLPLLQKWIDELTEGIAQLGTDRRGGQRLRETRAYLRFTLEELTAMLERWPKRKPELLADDEGT